MMTLMGQTDVKPSKSETGPTSIVSHLLYKIAFKQQFEAKTAFSVLHH